MEPNEMIEFVKALSHADRLRVIGALAQKPATAKEIADSLGMPFREVFQHLTMLEHGGIVQQQDEVWSLDTKNVETLSRRQFEGQPREAYTPSPDLSDKSRKVLKAYLNADGSLKQREGSQHDHPPLPSRYGRSAARYDRPWDAPTQKRWFAVLAARNKTGVKPCLKILNLSPFSRLWPIPVA